MKKSLPYLEVALAMIIMGTSVVVSKVIVGKFPTFLASFLRLTFSALFQFGLLMLIREPLPKINKHDGRVLLVQAFLGVFLYSVFFMEGLRRTTALESSIFSSFIPAAGGLIAIFIFHERPGRGQNAGIVLTILGTLIINTAGSFTGGTDADTHLLGNLLILLSAFCQAVFVTFGKLTSKDLHPIVLGAIVSALGAAMLVPFALYDAFCFDFGSVNMRDWGSIFYMGFICTGIGVVFMNHGNKRIAPSSVSVFTALNPVSAIVLSFVFLRERVYPAHIIGMSVIFMGIFLSVKPINRRRSKGDLCRKS